MKNHIPKAFIQDVVARTDIVSIIGARIELKKRGNTHTSCCPFHSEKTPSFTVSQNKQFYYCFGCGAHGNVIGFLMEYDRLSFLDAVTDLAKQLGLDIPIEENNIEAAQHNILFNLMEQAQKYFQKELPQSPAAIAYLKSRGLTGEICKQFGVGFAPDSWDFLCKSFNNIPETLSELTTAGMLVQKDSGGYYDRFRDRIMFPIRDLRGKTIGFGGRVLKDGIPKYLNSPETPIFHKNQTVYGLYEVNQANRELKKVLVVEGYLDVIALSQYGINYSVATLGTALNIKHIQTILRYTTNIIFCFDGDAAGKKAALRALTISLPLLRDGLDFKFLFLSEKEDPDSLIRKIGAEKFESLVNQAENLSDVFFSQLSLHFSIDTIAGKAAFAKEAHDLLQTMPDGIYKNLMLEKCASLLSLPAHSIAQLDKTPVKPSHPPISQSPIIALPKSGERLSPALLAICLLLQDAGLIKLSPDFLNLNIVSESPEVILLSELLKYFTDHPDNNLSDLLSEISDDSKRNFIARLAVYSINTPKKDIAAEFAGALQRLIEQNEKFELTTLINKSKTAELNIDEKKLLRDLLAKRHVVKINTI